MNSIDKSINLLNEVRSLIATPETWVKGSNALSAKGNAVVPSSNVACKFCLYGALDRVYILNGYHMSIHYEVRLALEGAIMRFTEYRHCSLNWFNDSSRTTHSDVLQVIDDAIAHQAEK